MKPIKNYKRDFLDDPKKSKKKELHNFRFPGDQWAVICQASEILGKSFTEFIIEAAYMEAVRVKTKAMIKFSRGIMTFGGKEIKLKPQG